MKSLNPKIDRIFQTNPSPISNPLLTFDPNSLQIHFGDSSGYIEPDPSHSFEATYEQIYGQKWSASAPPNVSLTMQGFAQQAETVLEGLSAVVMNGFKPEGVPVFRELVSEFGVCNQWFSSVPSLTQPNRLFVHSANLV